MSISRPSASVLPLLACLTHPPVVLSCHQDLESTLRMEYRSKLLNPKWAQAMAAQGSGGAYEISQRMTALVRRRS